MTGNGGGDSPMWDTQFNLASARQTLKLMVD